MATDDAIDGNVNQLVEAINKFPGLYSIGSCGGHDDPAPGAYPEGSWFIRFKADKSDVSWFSLEFLACLINYDPYNKVGANVRFYPTAKAPWQNTAGDMLTFVIESSEGAGPEEIAIMINELKDKYFEEP